jgi:crotonobetainyl-CoA:carnitine CoA-transferase CaiB-like acyl-CoA transferase
MLLPPILSALSAAPGGKDMQDVTIAGAGELPSWFAVSDLAAASIAGAGAVLGQWDGRGAKATVDRRLASLWFGMTLRPIGWDMPSAWDPIAGDYRTRDGWIRLHTNAPHHRRAALQVLGDHPDRAAVRKAVARWNADALEAAIVEVGGCAATMRGLDAWSEHPQGAAVSKEPLICWSETGAIVPPVHDRPAGRPLACVRILDLTRVLAGPVAGRFLAAFGADVLRVDPPDWDEPAVIPEVTLGKRCAGLDLKTDADRKVFEGLVARADVLLHGYRPGALEGLDFDPATLARINPGLIDVCLNAYGWTGPWSGRRGFDSLVQMSSGIADYGMRMKGAEKPVPLPVQALDHATGYLLAAAVLQALNQRAADGRVLSARLSLARTTQLLIQTKRTGTGAGFPAESDADIDPTIENTDWGPARRVRFPLEVDGCAPAWDHPAGKLRSSKAAW